MPGSADGPLDGFLGHPEGIRGWARAPVRGTVVDGDPAGHADVDCVLLVLELHRVADPADLLGGVRDALRPGGTLVVVTPSVAVRSVADLRWSRVLRPVRRGPWQHRSALDGVGWLLAAADFAVLADQRRPFALPLPDAAAARDAVDLLPAAGVWPDLTPEDRARLADELSARAGTGCLVPTPLRRLVARR